MQGLDSSMNIHTNNIDHCINDLSNGVFHLQDWPALQLNTHFAIMTGD